MYLILALIVIIAIGHKAQTQKGRTGAWWSIATMLLAVTLGTVIGAAVTSGGQGAKLDYNTGMLTWMLMTFGGTYLVMWLIVESLPVPTNWQPPQKQPNKHLEYIKWLRERDKHPEWK